MTKNTSRRRTTKVVESIESWPIEDEPRRALGESEIGIDQAAFYRWRRIRSEPPPPMRSTGVRIRAPRPR